MTIARRLTRIFIGTPQARQIVARIILIGSFHFGLFFAAATAVIKRVAQALFHFAAFGFGRAVGWCSKLLMHHNFVESLG